MQEWQRECRSILKQSLSSFQYIYASSIRYFYVVSEYLRGSSIELYVPGFDSNRPRQVLSVLAGLGDGEVLGDGFLHRADGGIEVLPGFVLGQIELAAVPGSRGLDVGSLAALGLGVPEDEGVVHGGPLRGEGRPAVGQFEIPIALHRHKDLPSIVESEGRDAFEGLEGLIGTGL